jgi:hypothetical protein
VVSFTFQLLYRWGARSDINWIGDWVDPVASMDAAEKRMLVKVW